MSTKINRRKEIKEKEELQARFQFAIGQANTRVTKWLPNMKKKKEEEEEESNANGESNEFFNLPIIPNGSGLNSTTSGKIGDFIRGEGRELTKKAEMPGPNKNSESKAMHALKNKMRNQIRSNTPVRQVAKNKPSELPPKKKQESKVVSDEDESENEESRFSTQVKKANIPMAKIGKRKKGRPF